MLIRCESCSTVYQLDESLLPPSGAPVQCIRCNHVFTAFPPPPEARAETLVAFEPATASPGPIAEESRPEAKEPPRADADDSSPFVREEPSPPVVGGPSPFVNEEPSPPVADGPLPPDFASQAHSALGVFTPLSEARTEAPVAEPPLDTEPSQDAGETEASGPEASFEPVVEQTPQHDAKNDTVTRFAADLKRRSRRRWLIPLLAVIVVGLLVGVVLRFSGGAGRAPSSEQEEAQKLMARDDRASLEAAIVVLGRTPEAEGKGSKNVDMEGDLCVALLLAASAAREEVDALDSLFQALVEQRLSGASNEAEIGKRMETVKAELETKLPQSERLKKDAQAMLAKLKVKRGDSFEVSRALALESAFEGNGEQVASSVKAARAGKTKDVWVDFAEAAVGAYSVDAQAKEGAVKPLKAFVTAHPEMLRARLALARVQIEQDQRDAALSTLNGLLAANSAHERAATLKASIALAQTP